MGTLKISSGNEASPPPPPPPLCVPKIYMKLSSIESTGSSLFGYTHHYFMSFKEEQLCSTQLDLTEEKNPFHVGKGFKHHKSRRVIFSESPMFKDTCFALFRVSFTHLEPPI